MAYSINWINDNAEKNLETIGRKSLESTIEDLEKYLNIGSFGNYGLSFDYVDQGYFRYQLSWGGPSDEIRFYENGAIEYVYMDWFCGIGFNVNTDSAFKLLRDYFTDLGMLDFEAFTC